MNTYSVALGLGSLQKYREVTAADSGAATDRHEGINFHGYQSMIIEVVAPGGEDMSAAPVTVQPLFWSDAAGKFIPDANIPAKAFAAPGQYVVDGVHDRDVFVMVTIFAGGYVARISLAPARPELTQD